ncbi:MAG: YwaF family protein [Clostridia bacterium]|nr:YwaF family protein [Clostridia bacterium]
MFTVYHFIWLAICAVLIAGCLILKKKLRLSLKSVLNGAVAVSILSEAVKICSVIKILDVSTGGTVPYIELNHLPIHLCSIQIIFILFVRFAPAGMDRMRDRLLAFMYPTCVLGATAALLMPSIFSTTLPPEEAFIRPMAYQFFLFHTMLIILGISIYTEKGRDLTVADYRNTFVMMILLAVVSIYLNSVFATPVYKDGEVTMIEKATNFFFTYIPPIPIALTKTWHWMLYIAVLLVLCAALIALLYIPVFIREAKKKKKAEAD